MTRVISPGRNLEVPEPAHAFDQLLPAEKLLGVSLLHLPIHIVQEHVRHAGALPVPRHHRRREDRRHASWRLREVPLRRVDHDQIPLRRVHLVREVLERQLAPLVAAERGSGRRAGGLGAVRREELVGFPELGSVADGVGTEARRLFEDGLDPLRVLLEEERGASRVETGPHEGVVAQPKDEEFGGPIKGLEDVEGDGDLRKRLLRHNLRGGVVKYRSELHRCGRSC